MMKLLILICAVFYSTMIKAQDYIDLSLVADNIRSENGIYKIGNPYEIGGVTYCPYEDYSYDEIGIASWYGQEFHGLPTANNELYDMNAFTAAHKTLPLPCFVKVTCVNSGKSIVVRVNDRGPFCNDRIIDLSRAAAEELGFIENGLETVRVQILPEQSKELKSLLCKTNITPDNYYVQLSAFRVFENAERIVARNKNLFIRKILDEIGPLYKVISGPYTKIQALNFARMNSGMVITF